MSEASRHKKTDCTSNYTSIQLTKPAKQFIKDQLLPDETYEHYFRRMGVIR